MSAPANEPTPVAPGVADIMVDPAKLLDVAKVVEDQASALEDNLFSRLGELRIDAPGGDIVSTNVATAWNQLIADGDRSYAVQVRQYVAGLHQLVAQLRKAAEEYHVSDHDQAVAVKERGGPGA